MNESIEEEIGKSWVALPRQFAMDRRSGDLSLPEYRILIWLFNTADPYGKTVISLDSLVNDVFNNEVQKNWVNKILLELKRKRYIQYADRTGRRGSFDVYLNRFLMKNKRYRDIDAIGKQEEVRGLDMLDVFFIEDVTPELNQANQRLQEEKQQLFMGLDANQPSTAGRGNNNDTNNKTKNNIKSANSLKRRDHEKQMKLVIQEMEKNKRSKSS